MVHMVALWSILLLVKCPVLSVNCFNWSRTRSRRKSSSSASFRFSCITFGNPNSCLQWFSNLFQLYISVIWILTNQREAPDLKTNCLNACSIFPFVNFVSPKFSLKISCLEIRKWNDWSQTRKCNHCNPNIVDFSGALLTLNLSIPAFSI